MIRNSDLFNLNNSILKEIFEKYSYPYELLPNISDFILELGNKLGDDYKKLDNNIWIHKTVKCGLGVEITGPAIIMENVELRHNAYIRENAIIGPNSVVGNSCEIKNSILISNVQVPHFNYIGDSILGNEVYLGAGVILANLRLDKNSIHINHNDTNLRKIGAFIGDNSRIGCNCVLCPGTIIYPNTLIYPGKVVKGIIEEDKKEIKVERL